MRLMWETGKPIAQAARSQPLGVAPAPPARSRRLHYSVGMTITEDMQAAILKVPAAAWAPAYEGDGEVCAGAWVADITGLLDLEGWLLAMCVIVRKERPHSGAG